MSFSAILMLDGSFMESTMNYKPLRRFYMGSRGYSSYRCILYIFLEISALNCSSNWQLLRILLIDSNSL